VSERKKRKTDPRSKSRDGGSRTSTRSDLGYSIQSGNLRLKNKGGGKARQPPPASAGMRVGVRKSPGKSQRKSVSLKQNGKKKLRKKSRQNGQNLSVSMKKVTKDGGVNLEKTPGAGVIPKKKRGRGEEGGKTGFSNKFRQTTSTIALVPEENTSGACGIPKKKKKRQKGGPQQTRRTLQETGARGAKQ